MHLLQLTAPVSYMATLLMPLIELPSPLQVGLLPDQIGPGVGFDPSDW
jgi:hypothetical protein